MTQIVHSDNRRLTNDPMAIAFAVKLTVFAVAVAVARRGTPQARRLRVLGFRVVPPRLRGRPSHLAVRWHVAAARRAAVGRDWDISWSWWDHV